MPDEAENVNLLNQSLAHLRRDDRPRARELALQAIRNNPRDDEAWWMLAKTADNEGECRQALDRALRLDPDHLHALDLLKKLDAGSWKRPYQSGRAVLAPVSVSLAGVGPDGMQRQSYLPQALIVLVMYLAFWVLGFAANIYWLIDAYRYQRRTGLQAANVGCLLWLLLLNLMLIVAAAAAVFALIEINATLLR